ncbi:unnamed protein product [Mytilus edulis]|uniref:DZIP3-like HEPN domain-containing protein n=1 Tax=Mytilus edulis TaxID=6550 RepID=A0A8S3UME4_MYTED|nr:unnamed protein product [Mytilus edulis]
MTDLSTVSNIEASDISPEEQYYIRIANLLLRVAPTAVRVKFDQEFYPGELKAVLNLNKFNILAHLKQKRVINQPQWDLLFPISGKPASDTFDLTLMICLIKNLTNIEVGDELPFSRNETDGADLTRIKYYRNKIMHSNDGIVSESTFKSWWDEISRAIIRLGGTSFEDRCSLMKLRKLDSNDKEVLTGIKNIIGTPDPVPKGLRQLWNATILEWENENVAKTRAISQLTDMITKGNVAVAVGPSGCGKSTAIHYIALQLSRTKEYEIIIPYNPDDMRHFFNPDCKQVFVIDDVFGDATFDENKGKQWCFCGNHMIDFTLEVAHTNLIRDRFVLKRLMKKNVEHEKVVKIPLANGKKYIERLKKDIEQGFVINVFLNQNLKYPSFRYEFIKQIAEDIVISLPDKTIFSLVMSMMDCGFCDIVAILLIKEIDLNKLNWDGETPLFKAACKGYTKVVQVMLEQKANPNFHACFNWLGEKDQRTAISWLKFNPVKSPSSIERSETYKLSPLYIDNSWLKNLPVKRVRPSPFERYGTYNVSPLHIATSKGYTDIVKLLLSYDADLDYATKCNQIESSLYIASIQGYTYIVHLLLENKSNSNVKISKYSMSAIKNSLCVAVEKGYCDIVKLLLDHYVNLFKQKDQIRMTPHTSWVSFYLKMIEIAVVNDRDNIVKLLIEKDCDSNISFSNFSDETKTSVLFNSICKGKTKIVKLLLEHNIDPNLCIKNNESPLLRATYLGFIEIIKILLEHNSNPNICNTENISPLYIASWNGHTGIASKFGNSDVVRLLIDHNCDPNICSNDNESALFAASSKGHTEVVKLLLDYNCDPNICNKDNKSSLFVACDLSWKDTTEIVELLLDHNCDPNTLNKDDESPLFVACSSYLDNTKIIKLLLDHKADPKLCNKDNKSPLFMASRSNRANIVKLLLDHNCDPNICSNDNESALFAASSMGHTAVVKLLLDHNCDPNIFNKDNKSSLFKASLSGCSEVVRLLLDHNSDPNICSNDNESALFAAASKGHTEVVKLLLDYNCNPNICNKDNKSPLFVACDLSLKDTTEIVELLLDHNCDPNTRNKDNESPLIIIKNYNCDPNICNKGNESPLFVASDKGYSEIVKLLLNHHCDPNQYTSSHETPLFVASKSQGYKSSMRNDYLIRRNNSTASANFMISQSYTEIVKLLLSHNADPNVCNENNESPLFAASSNGNIDIVKLLLDHIVYPFICNKDNESPLQVATRRNHTEIVDLLNKYETAKCKYSS